MTASAVLKSWRPNLRPVDNSQAEDWCRVRRRTKITVLTDDGVVSLDYGSASELMLERRIGRMRDEPVDDCTF